MLHDEECMLYICNMHINFLILILIIIIMYYHHPHHHHHHDLHGHVFSPNFLSWNLNFGHGRCKDPMERDLWRRTFPSPRFRRSAHEIPTKIWAPEAANTSVLDAKVIVLDVSEYFGTPPFHCFSVFPVISLYR